MANLLSTFWHQRSLVAELTKREFAGRYRGSAGGIVWSFAQPLFLLTIYTIAFGVILKTRWNVLGDTREYALMLFAGLILFNSLSECMTKAPTLITANPNFVKKVVFPLELLPVITAITALIHILIGLAVWLAGYAILIGPPKITVLFFPGVLIAFVPVLLGTTWLLSSLGVVMRDISQLTGLISHALLFLTPIFYSLDTAPPVLQKLLLANPLTYIVEQFRLVLYFGQLPSLEELALYFLLASAFAYVSLVIFRRLRPMFADML